MKRKILELDGLRAVAVLAVMVAHFSSLKVLTGGYLGVDLFFVLSGFLITSLLLSEENAGKVALGNFYARRALRILPPLFVGVAIALALETISVPAALAAIFFVANIVDIPMGAFVPMWSLSVEEHFYLLWPFLFIALARHRMRFVGYAILAVLATRVILLSMKIGVYQETYARADSLLIGCGAALMFAAAMPRLGRWVAPVTFATVLATFAFMPWKSFLMMSFGFTILGIVCAALTVAVLSDETLVNRVLRWGPLQYVGRRSYGLYVYHSPILVAFQRLKVDGDPVNAAWTLIAPALATLFVAELSYRTIEAWARGLSAEFRAERGGFPSLKPEVRGTAEEPPPIKAQDTHTGAIPEQTSEVVKR